MRHKWDKKWIKGTRFVTCINCGCSKESLWGTFVYYKDGSDEPFFKAPECSQKVLHKSTGAITDAAPFCKHDVGGSTANNENTSLVNDGSAATSETATVGGNKQTHKPCTCAQSSLLNECDNTCFEHEEFE